MASGVSDSYLPKSELTQEARDKRMAIYQRSNRCEHGVNFLARACQVCEAAGQRKFAASAVAK